MNMSRHDAWDELVSAALTGDLTREERRQLDLHLDGCAVCRETMASFAEQRRIVAGLRAVAPPRDLGARVRTGIERGTFGSLPWWRRPVAIFAGVGGGLALVAGVLLALVLLDTPRDPQIGQPTPTPSSVTTPAPSAAETPVPTLPPLLPPPPASVEPGQTAAPTPSSDATPTPSSTASPEPDLYLA
jgi:anti-sigma factor RsiW